MNYPIAEIFHSIQGEGRWTGTPMMFVRLAGCNVGRYEPKASEKLVNKACSMGVSDDRLLVLESKHSICTTFDGQSFVCDTDYHKTMTLSEEKILSELHTEEHICITGGEPFLHDLAPMLRLFALNQITSHIETSGTLKTHLQPADFHFLWITCCPKMVDGRIFEAEDIFNVANEWKILVGPNFKEEALEEIDLQIPDAITDRYLQPINGVNEIWQANVDKCLALLENWPHWKLSAQLHKYLEVR